MFVIFEQLPRDSVAVPSAFQTFRAFSGSDPMERQDGV